MTVPATRKRTRYAVAIAVGVLAVGAAVALLVTLSGNVEYFRTVSEAIRTREEQGDSRFRLMGAVVQGSITETRTGVAFELTDGKRTVKVVHRGERPTLFKAGAPVISVGRWGRGARPSFDSDRIMIKHGAQYTPPKVDARR